MSAATCAFWSARSMRSFPQANGSEDPKILAKITRIVLAILDFFDIIHKVIHEGRSENAVPLSMQTRCAGRIPVMHLSHTGIKKIHLTKLLGKYML